MNALFTLLGAAAYDWTSAKPNFNFSLFQWFGVILDLLLAGLALVSVLAIFWGFFQWVVSAIRGRQHSGGGTVVVGFIGLVVSGTGITIISLFLNLFTL